MSIRVFDPTAEDTAATSPGAARLASLEGLTIGLLDNGKPNSDKVLKKVAEMLAAQHPGLTIHYYRKPGAYRPAPDSLLDKVATECDVALVGIGD